MEEQRERERERETKTEERPNESTRAIACTRALLRLGTLLAHNRLYAIAIDIYT